MAPTLLTAAARSASAFGKLPGTLYGAHDQAPTHLLQGACESCQPWTAWPPSALKPHHQADYEILVQNIQKKPRGRFIGPLSSSSHSPAARRLRVSSALDSFASRRPEAPTVMLASSSASSYLSRMPRLSPSSSHRGFPAFVAALRAFSRFACSACRQPQD